MICENEIVSIDDIMNRYNLTYDNPLVWTIYKHENTLLTAEEKEYITVYINRLIIKQKNINKINLDYLEQQQNK